MLSMQEFQTVELGLLHESKTNPRKSFDKVGMEELTKSIAAKGVLVPLLVRPLSNGTMGFEIIAGARRFRAAKQTAAGPVPVRVMTLTDEEALELQIIENLQRADVHPLEEAVGFQKLMKSNKLTAEQVAAKVGKSARHVYARIQLTTLSPIVQKVLLENRLTLSHAILIARLQPNEQAEALRFCIQKRGYDGPESLIAVRALDQYIKQNFMLNLSAAPWKKADAELLPKAGACTKCPKQTGIAQKLFPDVQKGDRCVDATCFNKKLQAYEQVHVAELKLKHKKVDLISTQAYGRVRKDALDSYDYRKVKSEKACAYTHPGLVVDGKGVGNTIWICTNQKCKTHNEEYIHAGSTPASRSKSLAESKRRSREDRIKTEANRRILSAITKKQGPKLSDKGLRFVVTSYWRRLWSEPQKYLIARWGLTPDKKKKRRGNWTRWEEIGLKYISALKPSQLSTTLVEIALSASAAGISWSCDNLSSSAKVFGVNADMFTRGVRAEFKTAEKKKKAEQLKKLKAKKARKTKKTKTPKEPKAAKKVKKDKSKKQ